MECGQNILDSELVIQKGMQYKMVYQYPARWIKSLLHYIWNLLQYLVSFTTSDWIIQYLTSWYWTHFDPYLPEKEPRQMKIKQEQVFN